MSLAARRGRIEMRTADPTRTSSVALNLQRVYVWDRVVRLSHWLIALSIFTLAFTGFYIGDPYVSAPMAGQANTMGTFRAVHFYAAIVFTLTVLSRIYWAFAGSDPARWPNFIPVTAKRRWEMKETLAFYLFRRARYPGVLSHNPLAGLSYVLLYCLYFMIILTGLGIYGASAHTESWMSSFAFFASIFGGLQWSRWLHHAGMWLVLGFFVHHLYSAILASVIEKNGTLESIFTGHKWVKHDEFDR